MRKELKTILQLLDDVKAARAFNPSHTSADERGSSLHHQHGISARLWDTRQELSDMESAMRLLQEEMAVTRIYENRLKNAARPLFRLPNEVLSTIVSMYAPNPDAPWQGDGSLVFSTSAWTKYRLFVMLTCSALRDVVMRTPRCWPDVDFLDSTDLKVNVEAWRCFIQNRLHLSRATEIDLCIGHCSEDNSLDPSSFTSLGDLLLAKHWHRCRSLMLSVYGYEHDETLVSMLNWFQTMRIPTLRHLYLHFQPRDSEDTEIGPRALLKFLDNLPPNHSLQTLHIHHMGDNDAISPLIGHRAIRSLTRLGLISSIEPHIVLPIFEQLTSLEHLLWDYYDGNEEIDLSHIPPTPIRLPNLMSLYATYPLRTLFSLLETPRLSQASFVGCSSFFMSQHNFPMLRRLECHSLNTNDEVVELCSFLRRHPGIEELSLTSLDKERLRGLISSIHYARRPPSRSIPTSTLKLFVDMPDLHSAPGDPPDYWHRSLLANDLLQNITLSIKLDSSSHAWATYDKRRATFTQNLSDMGLQEGIHYTYAPIGLKEDWPDAFSYWKDLEARDRSGSMC